VERTADARPKVVACAIAAGIGVLVTLLVPVVSDVAEYAQWFRTGPPEGIEPLFSVFPALFQDVGGFPVFLAVYGAILCATLGGALVMPLFRGLSHADAILVVGALCYLFSPYFLFNQALLIRQSMASLAIVCFAFFQTGWLASLLVAGSLHVYGFVMIAFRRALIVLAVVLALIAVFAADIHLEAPEISRKLNFVNQILGDERSLAGLSVLRYAASATLTAALIFSRDKRIRTLGIVLSALAVIAPFVSLSGIFLTRINFLMFYWAPIIAALSLLREPGRFGVFRLAIAVSIFAIGTYTAVVSFVNLDAVISDRL
jgi:hypothetical protein